MIRMLNETSWLLALCGIFDAMLAAVNLLMLDPDGLLGLRRFALLGAGRDMGVLALAAGACAIAAGLCRFTRDNSWLLSLHGLALGAFGLIAISPLVRGPLSFRPVSLLLIVMAVSIGAFAFGNTRMPRSGAPGERWFLTVAGAAAIGYAFSFFAVGFGWLGLGPRSFWIWMSSYFAFCAIFMLSMAWNSRRQPVSQEALPRLRSPRQAH